jgi:muramidase (phage lysozyme)
MSFGNEIKDFVKAFTAAQANQSKNRYYDYMEQQARLRAKILEKKQQEADAPMNAYREGAKNAQGTTSGLKEGRSVAYGDPVADDLQPHQKAFLNAVAAPESGGKYNVRYNGGTPATFTGDEHPNILVPTDTGEKSSAAGRYQFTGTTWDEYGGGKFDPASQDRRAWELAQDRYGTATGRPLDSDLRTKGLTPEMMQTLAPTWQGFKANPGLASDVYNDSLKRYAPPAPQAALPLPVSEQPAQYASLDDPNQEYLYEQPEYAASGGLIDRRALGIPRLPSLSANALNVGGGIGSNYSPNLPNLGRTMQAIPGVSSPAPLIRHYARGGFVDYGSDSSDDGGDTVDDNEMQQASTALDTIGNGDDEDTPFSSVRPAVYDALHHIQNTFGLTPGAVQTNSQGFQAFASGAGRAHPELKQDVDKAVDPHDKMDDALRNMAGLDALYKYYRDRGEIGKAQATVSSLLLAAQDTASRYGAAALRAPDAKSAGKLVAEGINKTIPGTKAELDENGNYTFTDPVTGEVKETGQLSPQKLLAAAMGLKDGTMYWKTLSNFADPQRAQSAAQQKLAADRAANERLQGVMTRALDPNAPATTSDDETPATGTPATGAPTTPATPAAVGAPAAAPPLPPEQQPTALADPASVVPKLPVIPGGKLTGPAAAVLLKRPANLIETMTPEERKDFLGKSGSIQKTMQATYENGLKAQAQAKLSSMYQPPKELTAAERDHVVTHVGKAVDDIDENVVKPANKKLGKDEGMSPTDKAQVVSVAQELAAGNPGMFGNKAAEIAFKSVVLPPDMPTIPVDANGKVDMSKVPSGLLPFRFIPATQQHPAQLQTRDGKVANVTPNVREALLPVLQDSLQKIADKQQVKIKADAESARIKGQSDRGLAGAAAAAGRYMAEPGTPEPAPGSLTAPFQRTVPLGSTAVTAAQAARLRAPRALPDVLPAPPGRPLSVWELNQRR